MALKLVLTFKDTHGDTRIWSFPYAKQSVTVTAVKALAQGMITNGSIFKYPPAMVTDAKLVETTETDLDLE